MTTIEDALKTYKEVEDAAQKVYCDYWIERFKVENITFTFTHSGQYWWSPLKAAIPGYQIYGYTNPSRYDGIKLNIYPDPDPAGLQPPRMGPRYYSVKVKSESGFKRLIRRLVTGYYK